MRPDEYAELALETESNDYKKIRERLQSEPNIRLAHAAMGINTESGEFTDAIKKYVFYGKPIDPVNLVEELGDLLWYINQAIHGLRQMGINTSWDRIMEANIAKLQERYGGKFGETQAENRDLESERRALEGKE